jgi:hypothetical protein
MQVSEMANGVGEQERIVLFATQCHRLLDERQSAFVVAQITHHVSQRF